MLTLSGLHLLLSYRCTSECDHCFVFGSPWQTGTMTLAMIREILRQAGALGTVEWIYFEGGEPFLFHPVLLRGVDEAAAAGFQVGMVSNAYWATSQEDAVEWLRPLAGKVADLSLSSDLFHADDLLSAEARNARAAAHELGIPVDVICIAQPGACPGGDTQGQLPAGESAVMYRGRAVEKLAGQATSLSWEGFCECPHEDFRDPGRLHVDPLGTLHVCQGVSIGNLLQSPLVEVCSSFDPVAHPVIGPLLAGGPAELVRRFGLAPEAGYADACHLCFWARRALRSRFPAELAPDQMYGVAE